MLTKRKEDVRTQVELVSIEDLVPEDHLVRKIDQAIDFSFIYDLVKDTYSLDNGRPSIDPVVLIKMVFIQYIFGIRSMRQTIKEIETN
ncbi:transposase, partial [Vulcanibacillus modesticaldus]|uniref:transposase n=1 Tax=Vulcanibacillus modesticaldus TaxID=337097 RepID=UPI000ADA6D9D